jgi:large subunit ribosomal protein L11
MAKAKEVTATFKVMAPGGKATPAPPLGPILGANGVNPGQFIQQFNAATAKQNGKVCAAVVTVFSDRSFTFELKSSPAAALLKEAAKVEKGSGVPNKEKVGTVTKAQVRSIAEEKIKDLNASSVEAAMRMIEGSARSMGITVVER